MNRPPDHINTINQLDQLVQALLYEGYSLYPYRDNAPKNKTPIPFGLVYPEDYSNCHAYAQSMMQTSSIVLCSKFQPVSVEARFLQVNQTGQAWLATERKINSGNLTAESILGKTFCIPFSFPAPEVEEIVLQGKLIVGMSAIALKPDAFCLSATISNNFSLQARPGIACYEVLPHIFFSTHIIMETEGEFVSSQNPQPEWKPYVDQCENKNCWPVLVNKSAGMILSSPIILYDYPLINSQSKGDLFDSTEMEEALWLHVQALTKEEKELAWKSDSRIRQLLHTVDNLDPKALLQLHTQLKNDE